MRLGIVILNYKTYEMTISLIEHLRDRLHKHEYQIVVVDNCSPNESKKVLSEFSQNSKSFIFIESPTNSGYAAGNNIGIKYLVSKNIEYILVMNNDIEIPSENVIDKLIDLIESNPIIAAVSPRIMDKNEKRDPPIYFKKPDFFDLTFGIFKYQRERFSFDEHRNVKVYAPRGSFMLLRSSSIEQVNYLDDKTFLYYEEPILAERLEKAGFECWHCGEVVVIHNHAVTISSSLSKKKIAQNVCRSYAYYLKRYRNFNIFMRFFCVVERYAAILFRR